MCECEGRGVLLVLLKGNLLAVNELFSFHERLHVVDDKRLEVKDTWKKKDLNENTTAARRKNKQSASHKVS